MRRDRQFYEQLAGIRATVLMVDELQLRNALDSMIKLAKDHAADWELYGPAIAYVGAWFGLDVPQERADV